MSPGLHVLGLACASRSFAGNWRRTGSEMRRRLSPPLCSNPRMSWQRLYLKAGVPGNQPILWGLCCFYLGSLGLVCVMGGPDGGFQVQEKQPHQVSCRSPVVPVSLGSEPGSHSTSRCLGVSVSEMDMITAAIS